MSSVLALLAQAIALRNACGCACCAALEVCRHGIPETGGQFWWLNNPGKWKNIYSQPGHRERTTRQTDAAAVERSSPWRQSGAWRSDLFLLMEQFIHRFH